MGNEAFETIHEGRPAPIRAANVTELEAIREALRIRYHRDEYILDRVPVLTCEEIMVRTDYISDGPGFAGKLAVIFWGEPEFMTIIGDNGSSDTNWQVIEVDCLKCHLDKLDEERNEN